MLAKTSEVITLDKDNIKPASQVLARAFHESSVYIYTYPEADERQKKSSREFESVLRYGLRHGQVHTTSERLEGIAIWIRPATMSMISRRMWLLNALWLATRTGLRASWRMFQLNNYIETKHSKLAPFDHWYLMILGVEPEYQRKGYGGRLLRGMLALADEAGLPCYLETTSDENVAFYEHFGFNVVDEFIVPNTPVKIWVMLRRVRK
jgi:ribosomal protein S18 acetylase RimI-like enzyme